MLDHTDTLTTAQIIASENAHFVRTYARPPFVLSHGSGVTVWDTEGVDYLDFTAGIAVNALGHADAGLASALAAQAGRLVHTSNLYYTLPQTQLAERLTSHSFADRVFFTNSGTEANEAAIKFARKFARETFHGQRKTHIVCFEHAFHGRTIGSLSLTPKAKYQEAFRPLMPDVLVAPFNDVQAIARFVGPETCAVFVEPVQGEGGIHPATAEFMQALRARCDEVGALLVFDEVQCGLGRTGDLWAHTASGITPDMMTLAKPLAGGLPIGAALVSERVAATIGPGDHGSTFAGGPLITAAACYVFDRVSAPEFLEHVNEVGVYLRERLEEINSPHVKEVRGRGLMLGVQLDADASEVVKRGYAHHLLTVNAGPDVIRIVPPLILQRAECDTFIERFSAVLAEV